MSQISHVPLTVLDDLRRAVAQRRLWLFLATREIKRQYDRTVLGWLWIPINVLIHVGILGFLFSIVYGEKDFVPYFALGYSIWTTMGRGIADATTLWPNSEKYLRHITMPVSLFLVKTLCKEMMVFAMSLPVGILFSVGFGREPSATWLLAIPGIAVYFANISWITIVLSIFSLRYRDVAKFIPNALFMIYLSTPILWRISHLGNKAIIAQINPLYHMIELVRSPLLGESPALLSWIVAGSMAVIGHVFSLWLFACVRRRIVLWL